MKHSTSLCMLLSAAALAHAYPRSDLPSLWFDYKDWELVCDNTRTCRAAGYHTKDADEHVSILLTRRAGPNQAIAVELKLGDPPDDAALPGSVTMSIDGRPHGKVSFDTKKESGTLSASQVQALLPALLKNGDIAWTAQGQRWTLSTAGANAVLLKMDEFQGRIATPGALTRKGTKSESTVLPALPAPTIHAAPVPSSPVSVTPLQEKALLAALRKSSGDDCPDLDKHGEEEFGFGLHQLSATKLLVEHQCSQGAYNTLNGYWVVNAAPPYDPVFVVDDGSEYADGVITSSQRSRGLADCMSNQRWVWDGRTFSKTLDESTGMCREVSRGGTWHLPQLVTDVQRKR